MSIKLMNAVWGVKLNPTDKLVMIALADNASDEGVCWPSLSTICKKTGLSRRGVQSSVLRLQKDGVLSRIFRNGHSNNYLIRIINGEVLPQGGAPAAQGGVHDVRRGGAPAAPITIIEPPIESSIEPRVPDWLNKKAWEDFVAHRKSIKKPLTNRAVELAWTRLLEAKKNGHNPTDIINTTILNGWSGLFIPSEKQAPKPSGRQTL